MSLLTSFMSITAAPCLIVEKPFAASLAEADEMIEAVAATGQQLAINWTS